MSFNVQCPECEKQLRLRDEHAGKKIKCTGCGHRFLAASENDNEDDSIALADEQESPKRKKRPKRHSDDDRPRDVRQTPTPMVPMILSIFSLLLPCGPLGVALSGVAYRRIQNALAELPEGKRSTTARRNLRIGITLCTIGGTISLVICGVALVMKIMNRF